MKKLLTSLPPLLCIVALLLCMGCWKEKEQKTTADFRIVEYGTNQPIENARIILKRCTSEFLGGTYCDNVDTLYTNAQGRFALSIPQTPDTYQFSIDAANYFDYEGNDYLLQVNQH
ncbi:MAG: carboxypeptidase-like regulatory domain-containing protein, partial [Saprospiraceae bacterium]